MIEKYGKSLHDIFEIKQTFIDQNTELLEDNLLLARIARQQPKREVCKNCSIVLGEESLFIKHEINYYLCVNCNHLNGEFEDTDEFAKAVYVDEVTSYSKNYSASSRIKWNERVEKIYNPKAEFLLSCLDGKSKGNQMSVMDIGAGSGYLLKSLKNTGFTNVRGYEVSKTQVQFANNMLQEDIVEEVGIGALIDVISSSKSEIISMIGVLEHLTNPRDILDAISKNKNIKYYYLSLPLFSYSVFFELNNEKFFNRHLAGGHTHLYTKESISHLCNEFNFNIIGKWNFGADAMDLYRFNLLKMKESGFNERASELFSDKFLDILDDMQLVFDRAEFSSEVHILLENNNAL